jgi:hypothetical protein
VKNSEPMVPVELSLAAVLEGLVGSAMWASLVQGGQRSLEALAKRRDPSRALAPTGTRKKLAGVLAGAATFAAAEGPATESVIPFLRSAESAAVARQVFAAHMTGEPDSYRDQLLAEFEALADRHGIERATLPIVRTVFQQIWAAADSCVAACIDQGLLSAHEARSIGRHQAVMDQFASLDRTIRYLGKVKPSHDEVNEFDVRYRDQVADRFSRLLPPQHDSARKVPIDDIYVSPHLGVPRSDEGGVYTRIQRIALPEFLNLVHRTVVLGNPGAGKSTLAQRICYDLARERRIFAPSGSSVTPIMVSAREYGAFKAEKKWSILKFIEKQAASKFQADPVVSGAFEYPARIRPGARLLRRPR